MAGGDATTTPGGIGTAGYPPPNKRLNHWLDSRCMPLIEWGCVAGLPTLLCTKIVGLPSSLRFLLFEWLLVDVAAGWSLQMTLQILTITSILSLITILSYGESVRKNDIDTHKRGVGLVMGSHLIPIFYFALQLHILYGSDIEPDDSFCTSWEETGQQRSESCTSASVKEKYARYNYNSMSGRGSNHFTIASLGGMSFAMSCLWSQYSTHRKFNCKRRKRNIGNCKTGATTINSLDNSKGVQSECSATDEHCNHSTMSICWKAYLGLIILHFSSNYDVCTLLLGMFHLLLILGYDNDNKTATALAHHSHTIQGVWQDAFTPGEWMVVSTLITSLVGEYFFECFGMIYNFNSGVSSLHSSLPLHLIVAHAGLVGCIVGVTLCSLLKKSLPNFMLQRCPDFVGIKTMGKILLAFSLVAVAGITLGCLEAALSSFYSNSDDWTPRSVRWLFHFLSSEFDDVPLHSSSTSVLRVVELVYWACTLAICLPIASILASWITARDASRIEDSNANDGTNKKKEHEKRVIIARKYFHLVAILLFTPITWLDPDMMSLSYAIATALLVILEMARGWNFTNDKNDNTGTVELTEYTSWNQFYMVFFDEKDSSAAKGGLAVTHIALIVGCAFPLWVDQLLQYSCISVGTAGLSSSPPSGTLTTGYEVLLPMLPYLGVLVIGIGDSIGAISGINFGRHRWPGGSSRTLEGSLCMFLSMMIMLIIGTNVMHQHSSDITGYAIYYIFQAGMLMGTISLVEASTTQIDNLCLPIAGSTFVLLMTTSGKRK
ncbi:hypothetical protein ACHAXR_007748 [Thalassiosira sp. AJA248-18]